jgi:hypothetical protein
MIQTLTKIVTFEEFVNWLPDNSDIRYELHRGEIVKMAQPITNHRGTENTEKIYSRKNDFGKRDSFNSTSSSFCLLFNVC